MVATKSGNEVAHVQEYVKQFREIHFPCRRIFRKVGREGILQKHYYASCEHYLRNPQTRTRYNDNLLKVIFFDGASTKSAQVPTIGLNGCLGMTKHYISNLSTFHFSQKR